ISGRSKLFQISHREHREIEVRSENLDYKLIRNISVVSIRSPLWKRTFFKCSLTGCKINVNLFRFLAHSSAAVNLCIIKTNKNKTNKTETKVMKKIILFSAILTSIATFANAQNNASSTAQQTVQLQLSNPLEITFTGNNSTTGSTVTMPFTSANDYANGVESQAQQLRVRSNKNFNVAVKPLTNTFSVTNNGNTSSSSMPASVLD